MVRLFAAVGALLATLLHSGPSHAQFAVCNQTLDVLNVAIARDAGGTFETEGWWTIGANRCVDVLKTALSNQYVYVYASDVFGQPILAGTQSMCVAQKRFIIKGIESCWQRGHKAVKFMEVDTQAQSRWTLFLKEPGAE